MNNLVIRSYFGVAFHFLPLVLIGSCNMLNELPSHQYLPENPRHIDQWMRKLRSAAKLVPPIKELMHMVYNDEVLHHNVTKMFSEA